MKILLVDAYPPTVHGRKQFDCYRRNVLRAWEGVQMSEELKVETRRVEMLHDYTYLPELPGFPQLCGVKNFDLLDMIFIDGDASLLPWDARCLPLLSLLRMALAAKKPVFASGPGLLMLHFLCVCHNRLIDLRSSEPHLEGQLHEQPELTLLRRPAFTRMVARETGEVFDYIDPAQLAGRNPVLPFNADNSIAAPLVGEAQQVLARSKTQWIKTGDLGAQLGATVLPQYRPLPESTSRKIRHRKEDSSCRLRPAHMQHWLFATVNGERDLLVSAVEGAWRINSTAASETARGYTILADSNDGASIIEAGHAIGVAFHMHTRHRHSYDILKRFVHGKIEATKAAATGRLDIRLMQHLSLITCDRPVAPHAATASAPSLTAAGSRLSARPRVLPSLPARQVSTRPEGQMVVPERELCVVNTCEGLDRHEDAVELPTENMVALSTQGAAHRTVASLNTGLERDAILHRKRPFVPSCHLRARLSATVPSTRTADLRRSLLTSKSLQAQALQRSQQLWLTATSRYSQGASSWELSTPAKLLTTSRPAASAEHHHCASAPVLPKRIIQRSLHPHLAETPKPAASAEGSANGEPAAVGEEGAMAAEDNACPSPALVRTAASAPEYISLPDTLHALAHHPTSSRSLLHRKPHYTKIESRMLTVAPRYLSWHQDEGSIDSAAHSSPLTT